jgi:hypothetical protein
MADFDVDVKPKFMVKMSWGDIDAEETEKTNNRSKILEGAPLSLVVKLADIPTDKLSDALLKEKQRISALVPEPIVKLDTKIKQVSEPNQVDEYSQFPIIANDVMYDNTAGFTTVRRKADSNEKRKTSVTWAFLPKSPFTATQDKFLQRYKIYNGLHYPIGWIQLDKSGTQFRYHYDSKIVHVRDIHNRWRHYDEEGNRISLKVLFNTITPASHKKRVSGF